MNLLSLSFKLVVSLSWSIVECHNDSYSDNISFLDFISGYFTWTNCDVLFVTHERVDEAPESSSIHQIGFTTMDSYKRLWERITIELQEHHATEHLNQVVLAFEPRHLEDFHAIFAAVNNITKIRTSAVAFLKPLIVIMLWPEPIESEDEMDLKFLASEAQSLVVHSQIFVVYRMNNSMAGIPLHVDSYAMWELYCLKTISFVQRIIPDNPIPETDQFVNMASRRKNFGGANISAVAPIYAEAYEPIVTYNEVDDGDGIILNNGFIVSVFNDLRELLNFSDKVVKAQEMPNTNFSITDEDNLIGTKKQVTNRLVDMSLFLFTMLPQRAKDITFLHAIGQDRIWAFFRQPSAATVRNIYIQPFTSDVWAVLLTTWFLVIFSVGVINWALPHNDDEWLYHEAGIWALGALCQQGWHATPSSLSMKVVFISAMFTAIILFSAYCAAIISSLAATIVPVKTFTDLLDYRFELLADPHTEYIEYIQNDKTMNADIGTLLDTFEGDEHAVLNSLSGGHAFLTTRDNFYPKARALKYSDVFLCRDASDLAISNYALKAGMFVRKGSSLIEFFNYKISQLTETGMIFRYTSQMKIISDVQCTRIKMKYSENLGLLDVFLTYMILGGGYLISLSILCMEILWHRVRMKTFEIFIE